MQALGIVAGPGSVFQDGLRAAVRWGLEKYRALVVGPHGTQDTFPREALGRARMHVELRPAGRSASLRGSYNIDRARTQPGGLPRGATPRRLGRRRSRQQPVTLAVRLRQREVSQQTRSDSSSSPGSRPDKTSACPGGETAEPCTVASWLFPPALLITAPIFAFTIVVWVTAAVAGAFRGQAPALAPPPAQQRRSSRAAFASTFAKTGIWSPASTGATSESLSVKQP